MKRRNFLRTTSLAGVGVGLSSSSLFSLASAYSKKGNKDLFFKLSLAQWSIHRKIREENFDPFLFAESAQKWGFEGLEYVNQFYVKYFEKYSSVLEGVKFLSTELNKQARDNGMKNVLIMVDAEGDLASSDAKVRQTAVENHKKWVDIGHAIGCHAIRVNLFGSMDEKPWVENSVSSLTALAEYAATVNLSIIVENHGYLSSNGKLLASVMKAVGRKNCGTLPDFGNFCLKRKGNKLWDADCIEEYDRYQGVKEMMPFAHGVSAKSYDFDAAGNETLIDYPRMLKIVKDSGYTGFIGVEYEGARLSEEEGLLATKNLLIKIGESM